MQRAKGKRRMERIMRSMTHRRRLRGARRRRRSSFQVKRSKISPAAVVRR